MKISGFRFQVSGFLAAILAIAAPAQVPRVTGQQSVGAQLGLPVKSDPGSPIAGEAWLNANALKYRNAGGTTTYTLATLSDLVAGYQPLDSDLTAVAALTTTSFGRSFLDRADAAAGRAYLGLGTMATETATDYLTKAGNLSGLGNASTARANLGVAIGTDVQAYDSDLAAIAALTTTSFGRSFLDRADAAAGRTYLGLGTMATETATDYLAKAGNLSGLGNASAARTNLGVAIGTDVQAYDSDLAAIASLTTTSFGRSFLDRADAAAGRTYLGLGTMATETATDYLTKAGNLSGLSSTSTARTNLGVAIGTDVQAYSPNLTTFAAIAPSANVQTLLGAANYGAFRSSLGVAIGTDVQAYSANLAAISGLTSAADKIPYFTGSGTAAIADYTALARANAALTTLTSTAILAGNGASAMQTPGALLTTTAFALPTTYTSGEQIYNLGTIGSTDFERLEAFWSGNTGFIRTFPGGTGSGRPLRLSATSAGGSGPVLNLNTASGVKYDLTLSGASGNGETIARVLATTNATSGNALGLSVSLTYNEASGTASSTDIVDNVLLTAVGSGAQKFLDTQVNGTSWYTLSRGNAATTGAFNKSSGTEIAVNLAPSFANQTSTAGWDALIVNPTDGSGSGAKNLIRAQVGSTDKFTVGSDGAARRKSGTSSATNNFAGPVYMSLSAIGNVGAGEDDLISQTVAASVLATNGDTLRIATPVTFASNANNKTLKVYWNGTAIYTSGVLAINGGACEVVTTITRTGASTQNLTINVVSGNVTLVTSSTFATGSATLSGTVVFKLTGEATSDNDISEKQMICEYLPAP